MNEENKNEFENEEVVDQTPVEETQEVVEVVEDAPVEEAEEVTEAPVEEVAEEVEDAVEVQEVVEDAEDVAEVQDAVANEAPKKKVKTGLIVAIACIVVVVVAAILLIANSGKLFNKYNRKYIDTTGRTIAEVADLMGYDYADFLAQYELPADMPKNTYESAAMYSMPMSAIATMYGMTVDEMKTELELGDDVTETTTWGDAQDQATLANFVGEEALEQFKEQYGLGDDITGDTKWGDVRKIVDQYERDRMLEAKKEAEIAEEAEDLADEPVAEDTASTDTEAEAEATVDETTEESAE